MNEPQDDNFIMNELIEKGSDQKKTDLEVLSELFKHKEIETKTELTGEQVALINQKRTIAKILDFKDLDDCLNDFMLLMVSKNRKGRGEFIDGFKGEREHNVKTANGGFFQNIKERIGLQ